MTGATIASKNWATEFRDGNSLTHHVPQAASTITTTPRRQDDDEAKQKAKRLEGLRLSYTTYYDHNDMHLYDSSDLSYDLITFSSVISLFMDFVPASSVPLGLCRDYSCTLESRSTCVCIATVSKRSSDHLFIIIISCPQGIGLSIFSCKLQHFSRIQC
jgi:hypothetical protein